MNTCASIHKYDRTAIRTRRIVRCSACWLPVAVCVCAELPRIAAQTRVFIVMHHVETRRTSNTGRLAAAVLGATVVLRGERGGGARAERPEGRRLVLFPAAGARALSADDARPGALTLVVPDGNWRQASRVIRRDEAAMGAEVVTLPPGLPTRYRLRTPPIECALCTYEAIARALAILEDSAIETKMMRALDLFIERTLSLRGSPMGQPAVRGDEGDGMDRPA